MALHQRATSTAAYGSIVLSRFFFNFTGTSRDNILNRHLLPFDNFITDNHNW
jgi:hypothetical protein